MKMKKFAMVAALLAIMVASCSQDNGSEPEEESGVATITYHNWENSVRISNGDCRLIVVPKIGRIMYYGLAGGNNVLWENSQWFGRTLPENGPIMQNGSPVWANFGGDKVWPTEQSQFGEINGFSWPPDPYFDGMSQEYELLENGVKITSPVSKFNGARVIREIRLAETGTEVTINQTIEKVRAAQKRSVELIDYTIWNVTQIKYPLMTILNLNPNSTFSNQFYDMSGAAAANFTKYDSVAVFMPSPTESQKVGVDGDNWLAAVVGDVVIGEFFDRVSGAEYPDNGCSAQVYTSPEYTELEILSPFKALRLNETHDFTIRWRLHKLPESAVSPDQIRTAAVNWLQSF